MPSARSWARTGPSLGVPGGDVRMRNADGNAENEEERQDRQDDYELLLRRAKLLLAMHAEGLGTRWTNPGGAHPISTATRRRGRTSRARWAWT